MAKLRRFFVRALCYLLGHKWGDYCVAITQGMHASVCDRCQAFQLRHWGGHLPTCNAVQAPKAQSGTPDP